MRTALFLLVLLSPAPSAPPAPHAPDPPLIQAAEKGDLAELERLLLQGQDLNQTTTDGRAALHAAASAAQDKAVDWLIAHEANVFAKDLAGRTPADITTDLGHRSTSARLKKCMLLMSIIQQAVSGESWNDLEEILTRDSRRYTVLHVLAFRGNVEEGGRRIRAGADVNARTVLGITPLMQAAARGQTEMARLLMKSGADVNARDLLGNTPLIAAVVSGREEIVRLLLDAKADATPRSRNGGGTALGLAEKMGRANIATMLRQAGVKQ